MPRMTASKSQELETFWRAHLDGWRRSDLNQREYCELHGLAECAAEVLARIATARTPPLMAGVEIRRYGIEDKVAELASRLGLPVVTSFIGRGLFAGSNAHLVGTYLGVAGHPEITDLIEQSDGLLLLGVIQAVPKTWPGRVGCSASQHHGASPILSPRPISRRYSPIPARPAADP